jgi:Sigma-70, region 4
MLRSLPERQREALVLRYYGELSEAQAGAAMGISPAAARRHTARAVATLRTMLEQESGHGTSHQGAAVPGGGEVSLPGLQRFDTGQPTEVGNIAVHQRSLPIVAAYRSGSFAPLSRGWRKPADAHGQACCK